MDNPHEHENHESDKIPWGTVVILAIISCASLATGIIYWYNTYVRPVEYVQPALLASTDEIENGEPNAREYNITANRYMPDEADVTSTPLIPIRPVMDPLPEFASLWVEYGNEDIVARLIIAEKDILVVQGKDNEFYLTHNINGQPSSEGWPFMDYEVDLLMGEDFNMIIHVPPGSYDGMQDSSDDSHRSAADVLRHILRQYMDYYFFLTHPTITLATLYGDFEWEIFSFYVAPSDFPFAVVNHPCEESWGNVVEQFTLAAMYNTMLDVTPYDQVLTIATPTAISPDLFYVLQARMLRHITS